MRLFRLVQFKEFFFLHLIPLILYELCAPGGSGECLAGS